jgi:AraC-like DNA-binding protein
VSIDAAPRAVLRLQPEHLLLKKIAAELGFDDPNYFSRLFHRLAGSSPVRFRRALKRQELGGCP